MLKVIFLNGELQGSEFDIVEGLSLGPQKKQSICIPKAPDTYFFKCDSTGGFYLSTQSKKALIDFGGELLAKVEIAPGLILSIGGIGISIQEGEPALKTNGQDLSVSKLFQDNLDSPSALFPLQQPITLKFVRGSLLNTSIDIHWCPISIGPKSNLHHFADEDFISDHDILSFEKSKDGNDTVLKPALSNFVSINKNAISKPTVVKNGDLVEFSNTAFYIEIK